MSSFQRFGELLWHLSGSSDLAFIRYYIKDYPTDGEGKTTVHAAYGPRLKSKSRDQIDWVIQLLKEKPSTRRAVIPIYQPIDCKTDLREVPCTCTLQFLIRGRRLEMLAHMRSNDAYMGLPGDVFAFTMIQELVARALGVEVGRYKHLVGSLHLYDDNLRKAERFIDEGWQSKAYMPIMPAGDQRENIREVLRLEKSIRNGLNPKVPESLPDYWRDLVQLLKIYRADKDKATVGQVKALRSKIRFSVYSPYVDRRQKKAEKRDMGKSTPLEQELFH